MIAKGRECPSNNARQVLPGMTHDTLQNMWCQNTVVPILQDNIVDLENGEECFT